MQSFSASAKAEICREYPQDGCCALAECFGILLFCNCFQDSLIKIITESQDFAKLLPKLFRKAFGVSFDTLPGRKSRESWCFRSQIGRRLPPLGILRLAAKGYAGRTSTCRWWRRTAARRPSCGGRSWPGAASPAPARPYHLEFTTTHKSVARECETLIHETVGFPAKAAAGAGPRCSISSTATLFPISLPFWVRLWRPWALWRQSWKKS